MNLYRIKQESPANMYLDGECYEEIYVVAPNMEVVATEYPNAIEIATISKDVKILEIKEL